jgi:FeS assembly SUF system regulator
LAALFAAIGTVDGVIHGQRILLCLHRLSASLEPFLSNQYHIGPDLAGDPMLRLSKLTDYGIVMMTALAGEPERVFSAAELADAAHVEQPTASKVLKILTKADLVESFRGAAGGYRIHGNPERMSVADVITAMEGPIGMTECSIHLGLCAQESVCNLRSNWRRISQAIESALADVTLLEMSRPMASAINVAEMRIVDTNI